ncbi:MAG: SH3 domain-containing protein [Planctomycetaceae bacterium]|jgi:hypothetical protein|nr:SH3 domain-containing protein [Planctomycetaceae bacterium]
MRYIYCLILTLSVLTLSASLLGAEEPSWYIAAVQCGTDVLSGPGDAGNVYPVSQLKTGDKVEVYYEKNGYAAIRPPVGSYSWVSARYVRLGTNNTGTVTIDGLASIIGSALTDDCSTVQVRLKRGEQVAVLDRRETPENAESPLWLKIAPPSGEFRWIAKSSIICNNQSSGSHETEIIQVRYDRTDNAPASPAKTPVPSSSLPQPNAKMPDMDSRLLETKAETKSAAKIASNRRIALDEIILDETPAAPNTAALNDPFRQALQELDREVWTVMTRRTDDAVFDVLIKRGEELYQIAPSDKDLEKAFHLLESLKRTRQVRQELALKKPVSSGTLSSSIVSGNTSSPSRKAATSPFTAGGNIAGGSTPNTLPQTAASRFDITGKLGEFDPLPKGHPPYAVVDAQGQIICLVSPSAGVDLNSYIGKTVGINGILGFYERTNKPRARHITVKNVQLF